MGFSDLISKGNLDAILLVAIAPTTASGGWEYDIFLSSRYVVAPDITGVTQDVFYSGVIDAFGDFGYVADIAQCRFVLSDGSLFLGRRSIGRTHDNPISTYKGTLDISHVLTDCELHGAPITIAQAVEDASQSSGWLHEVIFRGAVVEVGDIGPDGAEIRFADTSVITNRVPKAEVTRTEFPDAPDDSIGRAIPIVYGDFDELDDPTGYVDQREWVRMGISNMVAIPAVCIDKNLGEDTDGPVYRISCHELNELQIGISAALQEPDVPYPSLFRLDMWDPINTSSYAQFETYWPLTQHCCFKPVDTGTNNNVSSAGNAYDDDPDTYATVGGGTGGNFEVELGSAPRLGTIGRTRVRMWCSNLSGSVQFGLWDIDADDWACDNPAWSYMTASSQPIVQEFICQIGNDPLQDWDIGKYALKAIAVSGGSVYIHEARLEMEYAPNRAQARAPYKRPFVQGFDPRSGLGEGFDVPRVFPSESQAVYAYCKGHEDDSSGTYTGTSNALIENAADIAHHLLRVFGGLSSDDVETGGGIGDFSTARTELGSYHKLAVHIGEREQVVETSFSRICAQSRAIPIHNASGKVGMVVIEPTPEADYRGTSDVYYWEPGRDFFADTFKCGRTPLDQISHRVFVEFDYCYMTDRFRKTAFITPEATDNGFGTDDDSGRKTIAGYGDDRFGEGREFRLRAFDVRNQGVAKSLRNFYFDSLWRPRVWGQFECDVHACDLSVGNVIAFGTEKINGMLVPSPDRSNHGWDDYKWYVESVIRVNETADDVGRYQVTILEAIEPSTASDWVAAADDS